MRRLLRLRAKWRLWWNLCPACNSDAPEMDTCPVCKGYRSSFDGPLTDYDKWVWLHRLEKLAPLLMALALTACATPHREPLRRDPQAHDWSKADWGKERFPNGHWE